jgi:hypothetical protein
MSRTADDIANSFNSTITGLIQLLMKKIPPSDITMQSNVERMKKRLNLARKEMGAKFIIENGGPILTTYRDQIIDRNEEFFTKLDIRSHYGSKLGKNAESVCELIDYIKVIYINSKELEKDKLYKDVCSLLMDAIDFNLLHISN